jgi:hypothetical protein
LKLGNVTGFQEEDITPGSGLNIDVVQQICLNLILSKYYANLPITELWVISKSGFGSAAMVMAAANSYNVANSMLPNVILLGICNTISSM